MHETWRAMEELVDEGLTKNIGLSNVQGSLLLDVLRYARFQPQVIQTELHPYLTFESFVKLAQLHGIAVTAYSSFGPAVSRCASSDPQHLTNVWLDRVISSCRWTAVRPASSSMTWSPTSPRHNQRVGCVTIRPETF
jgi:diketogulonate reductase-like aldo/keto reductase